ncbi:signal peptidase II [Sphaerisporangium krabiense]|uniref:Lipoprotein signal peptidase n=1 Tax=Sphaerisporangium krabiense TaxID=763782 RepID=A0A7W8Z8F3_9ACTN|nr:signal peptidase II [Sphaerisporangium krabiense]MBB5629314.1 signal peptidase II [Sphaerisporangium krabiense]
MQAAGGAPLNATPDATGRPPGGQGPARARRLAWLAVVAVVVYALDLISKTIVVAELEGEEPLRLIGDLLQLRVIRNSGAAFSIGAGTGMTIILTVIAAGVVVAILRTARRLRSLPWAITLGLLLGGALGNLTDRVFRYPAPFQGHVVDWIETFPGHFPVFNVADSGIVCGGILAVLLAWRGHQLDGTRAGDEPAASAGSAGQEGGKPSERASERDGEAGA